MTSKFVLLLFFASTTTVITSEETLSFWKGTALDSHIEKIKNSCAEDDTIGCLQYKAFKFLDSMFKKNYFQIGDNVEIKRNKNQVSSRSEDGLENGIEEFIKNHDVKFNIPVLGDISVDSTNLDNEEINLKLNYGSGKSIEARKNKKSKIKKIISPILIFILLKAITLVPFAIGILGLKAWNGLQLAFISFIISTGLAIFQLCQKLAVDHAHSHSHAHLSTAYEPSTHWARSLDDAQQMAYSAYNK